MMLPVKVEQCQLMAFVDTGSCRTIVPCRVFERLGKTMRRSRRMLTAFGNSVVETIGECDVQLCVGDREFAVQLVVVENDCTTKEMLLGRDVLCRASWSIDAGEITLVGGVESDAVSVGAKTEIESLSVGLSDERVLVDADNEQNERVAFAHLRSGASNESLSVGLSDNRVLVDADDRRNLRVAFADRDCEAKSTTLAVNTQETQTLRNEQSGDDDNTPNATISTQCNTPPTNTSAGTVTDESMNGMDVIALVSAECEFDLTHIQDHQVKNEVLQLVNDYTPNTIRESTVKLRLTLQNDIPVHQPPRRLAAQERVAVEQQVDEWLRGGIIRSSSSDYASPIVVVKKKDGTNRLCVDYRQLNRIIVKDRYPTPVIDDVLERMHGMSVFSTLDLRNGFFHVDVDEASRRFTSFVTPDGQYEFMKTPFGLCNSPAVFQRYINVIFAELVRAKIVTVYMDDLIIASTTERDNVVKLRQVLQTAAEYGLQIKWSKCQFICSQVNFLGHILKDGSVKPSNEKSQAIQNFPEPKNAKHIQAFLGLAGYFRKFVPGFASKAKPLSDLTRADVPFVFGECERQAFNELKAILTSDPVLKIFDPTRETELHTDASKTGYGACLLQQYERNWHPVFFLSKRTSPAEENYSSYELEVLAIIYALKKLRVYLLGLCFKIVTDCNAFQLTMKKRDLSARVARWALQLEEFAVTVVHRAGSAMRHVDALSRYPAVLQIQDTLLETVKSAQRQCPRCEVIRESIEVKGAYRDHELRRGVLYRVHEGSYLLVVPKSMQMQIIRAAHEKGHIGARRVEAEVRKDYSIDQLAEKCDRVVAQCVPCILSSRKAGRQEGLLNPIDKGDAPLDTYHVDHLGPLPSTAKNYKYILVVVDAFSKFSWLYPVKNTTAGATIQRLELQQELFGSPRRIVSDRAAAFTSNEFREYCIKEGIEHTLTTTGVPRGNGQVERMNGTIIPALTKLAIEDPLKWYQHVDKVQRFINSTVTRSTKRSPFEIMFGVQMRIPEDLPLASAMEEALRQEFEEHRRAERLAARNEIEKLQDENRQSFNKFRRPARRYQVGDLVAIQRTQFMTGGKLRADFMGPYRVISLSDPDRYEVERAGNGPGPAKTLTAADLMKPWVQPEEENDEARDGTPKPARIVTRRNAVDAVFV